MKLTNKMQTTMKFTLLMLLALGYQGVWASTADFFGPSVRITNLTANQAFATTSSIIIQAEALGNGENIAEVQFFANGKLLGSDPYFPYSFWWDFPTLGTVEIFAKVLTTQGNTVASAPIAIQVTEPAPVNCTTPYAEKDGLLVIEAENGQLATGWTVASTLTGYSGTGYILWNGAESKANPGTGLAQYPLTIHRPGIYRVQLHGQIAAGKTNTSANDVWLRVNDAPLFAHRDGSMAWPRDGVGVPQGAVLTPDGRNGWLKSYLNQFGGWFWQTRTWQSNPHDIFVHFHKPGTYTLLLSASSKGYAIDRIVLYHTAVPFEQAQRRGAPETVCEGLNQNNRLPQVALNTPTANQQFEQGAVVPLKATATDEDGTIRQVAFFAGTQLLTTDTLAPFEWNWANPAPGNYQLTARATDNQGGVGNSTPVKIRVLAPNQPPAVAVVNPANNSNNTSGNIIFRVNSTDADGSVAKVEFFVDNAKVGEDATAPFEYTWPNAAVGSYAVHAVATDNQGATATSPKVSFAVIPPNQAPTVALTAPANQATIVQGTTARLSAQATDPDGSIARVEFFVGSQRIATVTQAPWETNWTNPQAGTYQLTARATDNQGRATTSAVVNVTVVRPNVPPAVSLSSPTNNANFATGGTVNLGAIANDADGTVAKVEFFAGSTKLGEDATSPFQFAWTNVPAGTHTLSARATDNQGATANSASIKINVVTPTPPNQLPSVSLTAPTAGAVFTPGTPIAIKANATDSDGSIVRVEFFAGATRLGQDNTAPYEFTWTNAPTGTHNLTARAIDNRNGVRNSAAVSITVSPANQPPNVAIASPTANALFQTGGTVTILANATDTDGGVAKVEFFAGTTKLGEDATAPYSFAWANVAAGNYSITVRATDTKGAARNSAPVSIRVETPNQLPTVALVEPTNNSLHNKGANLTIRANASDPDGTVAKVEFFWGNTKLGEDLATPYQLTWNNLPTGTHQLRARVTDNRGAVFNSAAINITVVEPNVLPTVRITAPAKGARFLTGANLNIVAAADDPDGTVAKVEFFAGTLKVGEDATAPYTAIWNNVPTGAFALTARVTDNRGGVATSAVVNILVEVPNQLPNVAMSSPANNASYQFQTPIPLGATANDPDGGIARVEFYVGTTKLGEDLTAPFQFTWNNAPVGSHSITARAVDNKGEMRTSAPITVNVVQNFPPQVTITRPGANNSFTLGTTIQMEAQASDRDGQVRKVDFYFNNNLITSTSQAPYRINWSPTSAGTYQLTAKATDNQGAVGTSAVVSIQVVLPAVNAKPTVRIVSPANNSVFTPHTNITLRAEANDTDGQVTKVEYLINNQVVRTLTAAPWNHSFRPTQLGNYTVVARATDNKGDVTNSAPITLQVRERVPSEPAVVITDPVTDTLIWEGDSLLVKTRVTNQVNVVQVDFYLNDQKVSESRVNPHGVLLHFPDTGRYVLKAVAITEFGAAYSSQTVVIQVDPLSTKPTFTLTSLVAYPNPTTDWVKLSFTAQRAANARVWVYSVNSQQLQFTDVFFVDSGANEHTVDLSGLIKGMYVVVIEADGQRFSRKVLKGE